jgi:hypothetical protein
VIRAASATIGGEAVCCSESGVAVFEKLHSQGHDDRVGSRAYAMAARESTARLEGELLELRSRPWWRRLAGYSAKAKARKQC